MEKLKEEDDKKFIQLVPTSSTIIESIYEKMNGYKDTEQKEDPSKYDK